jgi:hypothetical protein
MTTKYLVTRHAQYDRMDQWAIYEYGDQKALAAFSKWLNNPVPANRMIDVQMSPYAKTVVLDASHISAMWAIDI